MDKTRIEAVIKVLEQQRTAVCEAIEQSVSAFDHRVLYEVAHTDLPKVIKRLQDI